MPRFGDPTSVGGVQVAAQNFGLADPYSMFRNPIHLAVFGLLLSPLKGLIWYSPVVLIGLIAMPPFARRHRLLTIGLLLTGGGRLLFFS